MCPGLFRSPGRVAGSESARIVLQRSLADTPVLVVCLHSQTSCSAGGVQGGHELPCEGWNRAMTPA